MIDARRKLSDDEVQAIVNSMSIGHPAPKGDWMQTFTGRRYHPADPHYSDFDIEDIAQGLSNCCRYAGQCNRFYSVAEHSVHVSRVVPAEHALQALLHDATEAYIGDVTRPLKSELSQYKEIEVRTWREIALCFTVNVELDASVKYADNAVLLAERAVLFDHDVGAWNIPADPADVKIKCWGPKKARRKFLERFAELWS